MWAALATAIGQAIAKIFSWITFQRQRKDAQATLRQEQLEEQMDDAQRAKDIERDVDHMSDDELDDELRSTRKK